MRRTLLKTLHLSAGGSRRTGDADIAATWKIARPASNGAQCVGRHKDSIDCRRRISSLNDIELVLEAGASRYR
jgi:hypothetical protein